MLGYWNLSFNKGFTLIEFTIAITIGMMLIGTGLVSYGDFNKRQTVKTSAQELKNFLRNIQSKALQGEKPIGVVCTILNGYQITISQASVDAHANCSNGNGPTESLDAPSNVAFSATQGSFMFKVLGEGVNEQSFINVSGFSSTYQYQLVVNPGGEVQDNGFIVQP